MEPLPRSIQPINFPKAPSIKEKEKKEPEDTDTKLHEQIKAPSADIKAKEARLAEMIRGQEVEKAFAAIKVKAPSVPKEIQEHIDLINNVLSKGIMSAARRALLNEKVVTSSDIVSLEQKDKTFVNLVMQGQEIDVALYTSSRGGICVALERENDNLPTQVVLKNDQEEADEEFANIKPEMRDVFLNRDRSVERVFTQESIDTLSNRAHRTVLVLASLDSAKAGIISIEPKNHRLSIDDLDRYANQGKEGATNSREHDIRGSLDPSTIVAIVVPKKLKPFEDKIKIAKGQHLVFAETIKHDAYYYKDGKGESQTVNIFCPAYANVVTELMKDEKLLGKSAKILLVMHMVKF